MIKMRLKPPYLYEFRHLKKSTAKPMWVQSLSHTGSESWLVNDHHENMSRAEKCVGSLEVYASTLAGSNGADSAVPAGSELWLWYLKLLNKGDSQAKPKPDPNFPWSFLRSTGPRTPLLEFGQIHYPTVYVEIIENIVLARLESWLPIVDGSGLLRATGHLSLSLLPLARLDDQKSPTVETSY
jgi:hypothetical protein